MWVSLEIQDARKQQGFLGLQNYRTEQYAKALEEDNKKLEAENAELKARAEITASAEVQGEQEGDGASS